MDPADIRRWKYFVIRGCLFMVGCSAASLDGSCIPSLVVTTVTSVLACPLGVWLPPAENNWNIGNTGQNEIQGLNTFWYLTSKPTTLARCPPRCGRVHIVSLLRLPSTSLHRCLVWTHACFPVFWVLDSFCVTKSNCGSLTAASYLATYLISP